MRGGVVSVRFEAGDTPFAVGCQRWPFGRLRYRYRYMTCMRLGGNRERELFENMLGGGRLLYQTTIGRAATSVNQYGYNWPYRQIVTLSDGAAGVSMECVLIDSYPANCASLYAKYPDLAQGHSPWEAKLAMHIANPRAPVCAAMLVFLNFGVAGSPFRRWGAIAARP